MADETPDVETALDPDESPDQASELEGGKALLVVRAVDLRGSDGESDVRVVELGALPVTVGRAAESTIQSADARVSRRHLEVRFAAGAVTATDCGSRNGTKINGELLRGGTTTVRSGDVITVGPFEIVVAAARASTAATASATPDVPSVTAAGEALDPGLVIADSAMLKVFRIARRVAAAPTTVLVTGETGVGKELVAEAIHRLSARRSGPFVRINCAAIPPALLESELFGHERGAFTGAERTHSGIVEQAHRGTLFLDEIGDMPLAAQVALLRVLESKVLRRVGGARDIPVDVRVICATHRDLAEGVATGAFRQDLYYRLSPITIEVPPLRSRRTEIVLLADFFLRELARRDRRPVPQLSEAAARVLVLHAWPGNIRELKNVMEHAFVLVEGHTIEPENLPLTAGTAKSARGPGVRGELADIERLRIIEALASHGGNRTHAAGALGMSRRALLYKLQKYGLDTSEGA